MAEIANENDIIGETVDDVTRGCFGCLLILCSFTMGIGLLLWRLIA